MKVKIGNTVYDSREKPIMLVLSEVEKEHIKNMLKICSKYCQYPAEGYTGEEIEKFMEEV